MTVEEKVRNLGDLSAGAPRVGLPPYRWWAEALHGVASTGPATLFDDVGATNHSGRVAVNNATVFANVINSAASFNETLWKAIGQVRITSLVVQIYLIRSHQWQRMACMQAVSTKKMLELSCSSIHQRCIRLVNREEHRHDSVSVCMFSRASVKIYSYRLPWAGQGHHVAIVPLAWLMHCDVIAGEW